MRALTGGFAKISPIEAVYRRIFKRSKKKHGKTRESEEMRAAQTRWRLTGRSFGRRCAASRFSLHPLSSKQSSKKHICAASVIAARCGKKRKCEQSPCFTGILSLKSAPQLRQSHLLHFSTLRVHRASRPARIVYCTRLLRRRQLLPRSPSAKI